MIVPATAYVAAAGVAVLLLSACTAASPGTAPDALPQGDEAVELDPADFSTTITNAFWPMEPGTQWTYRELDADGTEFTVFVTVTTATKQIANGIEARVVRDTVWRGSEIVEDTFDWYAQHSDGTIWYLGEDTAEFENGEVVSTEGSFEAGVDGALAGIVIPGEPKAGMKYRQEYYAGAAEDNGEVLSVNEVVQTAYGSFEGCLMTKDTSSIEPDVLEHKFYAPGIGPVLTLDIASGAGREELVSVGTVADGLETGPLGKPDTRPEG